MHLIQAMSWMRLNGRWSEESLLWFGKMSEIDPTQSLPLVGFALHLLLFKASKHPILYRARELDIKATFMIFGASLPLLYFSNCYVLSYLTLVSMQVAISYFRNVGLQGLTPKARLTNFYRRKFK